MTVDELGVWQISAEVMTMKTFRIPLWRKRSNASYTFFYEDIGSEEGFMVRIPTDRVSDGVTYMPLRTELEPSGASERFVAFLLKSVVARSEGKVSVKAIWCLWAEKNGVDADTAGPEIAGVQYSEVAEHFRDAFNAGSLGRGRLDGVVQRVWHGFELVRASEPPTSDDQSGGVDSVVYPGRPGDSYSVRGDLDKTTSLSYRYELRGEGVRGRIYLDKDLVGEAGSSPEIGLRIWPKWDEL